MITTASLLGRSGAAWTLFGSLSKVRRGMGVLILLDSFAFRGFLFA